MLIDPDLPEELQFFIGRALLNRADLTELRRHHRELLTPLETKLLWVLQEKIDYQPDRFARAIQRYREIAGVILLSGWPRAVDFCTCMHKKARQELGIMNKKRRALNCRLWRVCPHCAWRREMDLQCRFLPSFNKGVWNWLTASFTGNLPLLSVYLNRDHPVLTHADLATYLEGIRFAVDQLVTEGIFRGAILTEEIHLETLHPMALVTPHSHILVLTDEPLNQAHLDRFTALLLQFRGQQWDLGMSDADDLRWQQYYRKLARWDAGQLKNEPRTPSMVMVTEPRLRLELPISLDLQPLVTEKDFSDRLGYLVKPVGLQSAYSKTRAMLIYERNWFGLELLAQNTDEFIRSLDQLLHRRRSPAYFGACDPRRRSRYIGQPGFLLDDDDHRKVTKDRLRGLIGSS